MTVIRDKFRLYVERGMRLAQQDESGQDKPEEGNEWDYICPECGESGTEREFINDKCPECGYSGRHMHKIKSTYRQNLGEVTPGRYGVREFERKRWGDNGSFNHMRQDPFGNKVPVGVLFIINEVSTFRVSKITTGPNNAEYDKFISPRITIRESLHVPDMRWDPSKLNENDPVTIGITDAKRFNETVDTPDQRLLTVNKNNTALWRTDKEGNKKFNYNMYKNLVNKLGYLFVGIEDGPDGQQVAHIRGPVEVKEKEIWVKNLSQVPPGTAGAKKKPLPGQFEEPREFGSIPMKDYRVPLYMIRGINSMKYPNMDIGEGYYYTMDPEEHAAHLADVRQRSIENAEIKGVPEPPLKPLPRLPSNKQDAERMLTEIVNEEIRYYVDQYAERDKNPQYRKIWRDPITKEDTYERDMLDMSTTDMETTLNHDPKRHQELVNQYDAEAEGIKRRLDEQAEYERKQQYKGMSIEEIKEQNTLQSLRNRITEKILQGGGTPLSPMDKDRIQRYLLDMNDKQQLEQIGNRSYEDIVKYFMYWFNQDRK